MPMLKDPSTKYKSFTPPNLDGRQWPSRVARKPPRWLATDLRDGNQSLPVPMDIDRKWRYFRMLIALGYREIEIACPTTTQADYDFVRRVVESPGLDNIWLQALSACNEEMIAKTVEALTGAKKAILHLYMATSECFQRIVFGLTNEESLAMAIECTRYARSITKDNPVHARTEWTLQFCPEAFSDTSPEFAVQVCEAVKNAWRPSIENPIIFNLTATVEMSTPNVYADQIEYFCTHITEREKVCVSLHTHNDRGCAVAAAELGQLAGADRVEGVLFGNGERTGNADLVTLALNLYTQGISPGIDFSDIPGVVEVVEDCNRIAVNPRAPYGGSLVVSAFGGSHQDAIEKGFETRRTAGSTLEQNWEVPYLPFDPEDLGRSYVRITKDGSTNFKLTGIDPWGLPPKLKSEVQGMIDKKIVGLGRGLSAMEARIAFERRYFVQENGRLILTNYTISRTDTAVAFEGVILVNGEERQVKGRNKDETSALATSLRTIAFDVSIQSTTIRETGKGADIKVITYMECLVAGIKDKVWGVGVYENELHSSFLAVLSAVARAQVLIEAEKS